MQIGRFRYGTYKILSYDQKTVALGLRYEPLVRTHLAKKWKTQSLPSAPPSQVVTLSLSGTSPTNLIRKVDSSHQAAFATRTTAKTRAQTHTTRLDHDEVMQTFFSFANPRIANVASRADEDLQNTTLTTSQKRHIKKYSQSQGRLKHIDLRSPMRQKSPTRTIYCQKLRK